MHAFCPLYIMGSSRRVSLPPNAVLAFKGIGMQYRHGVLRVFLAFLLCCTGPSCYAADLLLLMGVVLCCTFVAVQLRADGGLVSCSRATLPRTMSGTMGAWARSANADPQVSKQGNELCTPMPVLCAAPTSCLVIFPCWTLRDLRLALDSVLMV